MQAKHLLKRLIGIFIILLAILLLYPTGYFVLDNHEVIHYEASSKDLSGIGAYVINLDRSKERYEYVKHNINGLGIPVERISGIDGKTLSQEEINTKVDFHKYQQFLGHLPKLGMIGCTLSHIKAWQTFLESDFEYAIIFEDDISFEPIKVRAVIDRLIEQHKYWDMSNLEISHKGTPLTIKVLSDNQKLVVYLTEVTHAGAYIINKKAATKLLEKALPIKLPIDHYFTRSWEFGLKFTGVEPRLVYQTFGDSDLNATKRLTVTESSDKQKVENDPMQLTALIHRGAFKLQSYVIRFLYNLKCYFESKTN